MSVPHQVLPSKIPFCHLCINCHGPDALGVTGPADMGKPLNGAQGQLCRPGNPHPPWSGDRLWTTRLPDLLGKALLWCPVAFQVALGRRKHPV